MWSKERLRQETQARRRGYHGYYEYQYMGDRYGWICLRCGTDENVIRDHIRPISRGGSHSIRNIQPLCLRCNAIKSNRGRMDYRIGHPATLIEWLAPWKRPYHRAIVQWWTLRTVHRHFRKAIRASLRRAASSRAPAGLSGPRAS